MSLMDKAYIFVTFFGGFNQSCGEVYAKEQTKTACGAVTVSPLAVAKVLMAGAAPGR